MALWIISIVYLLVGIFLCGVHYARIEEEKLKHHGLSYLITLLLWPILAAFAYGQVLMEEKYK